MHSSNTSHASSAESRIRSAADIPYSWLNPFTCFWLYMYTCQKNVQMLTLCQHLLNSCVIFEDTFLKICAKTKKRRANLSVLAVQLDYERAASSSFWVPSRSAFLLVSVPCPTTKWLKLRNATVCSTNPIWKNASHKVGEESLSTRPARR